uniref:Uncharacterized protein n=1 Tax=Marseillevirus LCMAC103 TaxID=2506604 RepID=A0A481YWL9_9VIRU|nr:MAG: hypothetical protein LCMAC103_02960 [Marseillevirus LCMAC103]
MVDADAQQTILSFLSLVDEYDSFDLDLLARRKRGDPAEEWTMYAIEASGRGDLAKVRHALAFVSPTEQRWCVYAAAAQNMPHVISHALARRVVFDRQWARQWARLAGSVDALALLGPGEEN